MSPLYRFDNKSRCGDVLEAHVSLAHVGVESMELLLGRQPDMAFVCCVYRSYML
jgi:hypothetical protein